MIIVAKPHRGEVATHWSFKVHFRTRAVKSILGRESGGGLNGDVYLVSFRKASQKLRVSAGISSLGDNGGITSGPDHRHQRLSRVGPPRVQAAGHLKRDNGQPQARCSCATPELLLENYDVVISWNLAAISHAPVDAASPTLIKFFHSKARTPSVCGKCLLVEPSGFSA